VLQTPEGLIMHPETARQFRDAVRDRAERAGDKAFYDILGRNPLL
jgi:hypothetical protein